MSARARPRGAPRRSRQPHACGFPGDPQVQTLTPDDFDLGRIQLKEPGPIPEHEARWAWDWVASWGLLEGTFDVGAQINRQVEREAHEHAAALAR